VAIDVAGWFGFVEAVIFKRYTVLMMGVESATIRNMIKAMNRRRNVEMEMPR
jgi:hypothetical protein